MTEENIVLNQVSTIAINQKSDFPFSFVDFISSIEEIPVIVSSVFKENLSYVGKSNDAEVSFVGGVVGVFELEGKGNVNHTYIKLRLPQKSSFANRRVEECLLLMRLFKMDEGADSGFLSRTKPNLFYSWDYIDDREAVDVVIHNSEIDLWEIYSFPLSLKWIRGLIKMPGLPSGTRIFTFI